MYNVTFNNKTYTVGSGVFAVAICFILAWFAFLAFSIYTTGSILTGYPLIFFIATFILTGNMTVNGKFYAFVKNDKVRRYVGNFVCWGSVIITIAHLSGKI